MAESLRYLRADVGDVEFGYRAQGLFAYVLERIGRSVIEIRSKGHPDIVALVGGSLTKFEVEIASMSGRSHVIKKDDVQAVAPGQRGDLGYLAVLDMAEPVRWAPLAHSRICKRLGRVRLTTMHALADQELARACNDAFADIVIENAERLPALTFHLLRQRVLSRNNLRIPGQVAQ